MTGFPRASVLALAASACLAAPAAAADRAARQLRVPLAFEYNRDLPEGEKERSIRATLAQFRDLDIEVQHSGEALERVLAGAQGRLAARPVEDPDLLYDAVYYLTDLVRLPPGLHPLYSRVLLVEKLRAEDSRTGRLRDVPAAYENATRTLVVDHSHLNQLEYFGNFIHPKVNFAMLLQVALEARLERLGPEVLRELGLEAAVVDEEWARLNGGRDGGFAVYSGEDLTFVGVTTAVRLTPPGMIYDAIREASSGVPADTYAGMADSSQPWFSPRYSPALDRQTILRALFSREPLFFERLSGRAGRREDRVLREKVRLILYAAFAASGGRLDHAYWKHRHRDNEVVDQLTRDFDGTLLEQLQQRLARNPRTRGTQLGKLAR